MKTVTGPTTLQRRLQPQHKLADAFAAFMRGSRRALSGRRGGKYAPVKRTNASEVVIYMAIDGIYKQNRIKNLTFAQNGIKLLRGIRGTSVAETRLSCKLKTH